MKVYGVHTNDLWLGADLIDLYKNIEDAVHACIVYADLKQKEWDDKYQNHDNKMVRRWEQKECSGNVIKNWGNGISEIYIVGYELK